MPDDTPPTRGTITVTPKTRLSELISEAEKHGYHVVLRLTPRTCSHGKPCCDACKALPENQHAITVYP